MFQTIVLISIHLTTEKDMNGVPYIPRERKPKDCRGSLRVARKQEYVGMHERVLEVLLLILSGMGPFMELLTHPTRERRGGFSAFHPPPDSKGRKDAGPLRHRIEGRGGEGASALRKQNKPDH